MAPTSHYLAVLKAAYDYNADSEEELSIKEDQILLLIERTDDDWWRVKPRDADESVEGGLVPAAYVEQAPHKSVVKALYDYDASAPGELSTKEDEVLLAFDAEDGWLLVQTEKEGGRAGFVPENYVEATDAEASGEAEPEQEAEEEEEAPAVPAIIVPPSPPRPSAPYVDPAERVAASHTKAQPTDHIKTWSVSEVDKKGKKKKGTLGIGNGSIFFASEADKTPVQKWPITDVENSYMEKTKHVHIEISGSTQIHLHFNAGSKDYAEAIIEKLDKSKAASREASAAGGVADEAPTEKQEPSPTSIRASPKPKKNGVSVHFAQRPPSIISPREPDPDSEPEEDYVSTRAERPKQDDGSEWCTVLYDFTADGDDELSVQEGDRLIVLEKDGDEWWKVRDSMNHEGVVPASYVELDEKIATSTRANGYVDDGATAREAAAREARERQQEEDRKRAEQERKAKLAADAAKAEHERKERERERKLKEEEERRRRLEEEEEEEEEDRKRAARQARPTSASGSRTRSSEDQRHASPARDKARASSDKTRPHPDPARVRTWHDRTGQFKVDAEFLGFQNGKLRLHKTNGVVIEVPAEKMSQEDLKYIERMQGGGKGASRALSPGGSDDEPLATRRQSLQPEAKKPVPPKKGKSIDWFEFFLNAGCDIDDCTRYATSFERDKIDEAILPDITEQTMRSLGLREGDIIRVTKAVQQRTRAAGGTSALEEQMRKDEELARRIQEEESKNTPKRQMTASPGLFAGPGGVLKNNTRRGRPQPSKSTPPATVDLQSLATASEQITRMDSPLTARITSPVSGPPRASSAAPVVSGFDDDAWTNRPSSVQPVATTSTGSTRAPSAPPAQTQAAATQSPPAAPAPPPAPAQTISTTSPTSTGSGLARTTESDVFDQLARLSALKIQNRIVGTSTAPPPQAQVPASAPVSAVSLPPASFQSRLGMGSSPAPIGQLQTQVTSFQQQQQNGPRGPLAPVPANQGLLQPLVPTTTGFNSFVPTRPSSNPPTFNATSPQPSFLNTQPTGFRNTMAPQPTGFPGSMNIQPTGFSNAMNMQPGGFGSSLHVQPTGLPNSGPLMAQTTSYPGALGSGPFSGGRAFGPLQPNVTGFNPGFGQATSPPPPVPPIPPLPTNNANNNNTAPASVFAQMKSGTFANDNAPQSANKYDALRPQPTGWGMPGTTTGFQSGYPGQFY